MPIADWPSRRFGPTMPQWGWGWPCCCGGCVPACTPGTATVGNTGTADCTDALNLFFSDNFNSGTLAGNGWLGSPGSSGCGAATLDNALAWSITGGVLKNFSGNTGTIYVEVPRPALAGFALQVSMTVVTQGTGASPALTVGYGRWFRGNLSTSDYRRHAGVAGYGCPVVLDFAGFGPVPANGDTMTMIIRDQGGADGICTVCYRVNGATVRQEQDVQFCFPCTMLVGINASTSLSTIDDFSIHTS